MERIYTDPFGEPWAMGLVFPLAGKPREEETKLTLSSKTKPKMMSLKYLMKMTSTWWAKKAKPNSIKQAGPARGL